MGRFWVCVVCFLLSLACRGAVFFKGKQVMNTNWQVDLSKLCFGASPTKPDQDRIQGQLAIRAPRGTVASISVVLAMLDAGGETVGTVTVTPGTCVTHGKSNAKYPFCGVENESVSGTRGKQTAVSATQMRRSAHAWFYADFPQRKEVKNLLVVDVRFGSSSVNYNSNLIANKVPRSYTALPKMQHGSPASIRIVSGEGASELSKPPEGEAPKKVEEVTPKKPDGVAPEKPVAPVPDKPVVPVAERPVVPVVEKPATPETPKPPVKDDGLIKVENENDLMKLLFKDKE